MSQRYVKVQSHAFWDVVHYVETIAERSRTIGNAARIHPTPPRRDQVSDGGARRTLGAPGRSGRAVGVGCHALRSDQQPSCTGALGAVAGCVRHDLFRERGGNVGSGMGLIVI